MQNGLTLNLKVFLKTGPNKTDSDNDLSRTKRFKYLGLMLLAKGELCHEVASPISET